MATLKLSDFITQLRRVALLVSATAATLYLGAFLWAVLPLHIKRVEARLPDGSEANPRLEREVEKFIANGISDSLPLLYLKMVFKGDFYRQRLEGLTDYYVRDFRISSFSPKGGVLRVKVWTRKAAAVLNDKYLLSPKGVVFGYLPPKAFFKIEDKTGKWYYGDTYRGLDFTFLRQLAEKFDLNLAVVKGSVVTLKGKNFTVAVRREMLSEKNLPKLERILSDFKRGDGHFRKVELFGKRIVYVKIIKESSNE